MTQEQLNEGNRLVKEIAVLKKKATAMNDAWEELERRKDSDPTVYLQVEGVAERIHRAAVQSIFFTLRNEYLDEQARLEEELRRL